jgi:cytochrome c
MKYLLLCPLVLLSGCELPSPQSQDERRTHLEATAAINRYGCASCHTIPSIAGAEGRVAPPLDHMGSRGYVAGVLINNPQNLERWIRNPPEVDSQTAMPNLGVTEADAAALASFLSSLR